MSHRPKGMLKVVKIINKNNPFNYSTSPAKTKPRESTPEEREAFLKNREPLPVIQKNNPKKRNKSKPLSLKKRTRRQNNLRVFKRCHSPLVRGLKERIDVYDTMFYNKLLTN